MKTLVIHPKDITTDFLSAIYVGKDWTVINTNVSKKTLKDSIKSHDRIIMLGHGSDKGLFGFKHIVIDSNYVYLLKDKICVCVWCNADLFVKKYSLKGLFTGMIVSDTDEMLDYCLIGKPSDVEYSNKLFASAIEVAISDKLDKCLELYESKDNSVIDFNKKNIYENI
jgi:hypothetical protein